MSPSPRYLIDRMLTDEELGELANDAMKIPNEMVESLEIRFAAAQVSAFYQGFIVASLDAFHHLRHADAPHLALRRLRFLVASILHNAGCLFRDIELPYPPNVVDKLSELPLPARSAIRNLLMDCPCDICDYDQLETDFSNSETESLRGYLQLDKPPLFYAGLFHGYYKLYSFLAEVDNANLADKADFAMPAAVFLAEKLSRKLASRD